MKCLTYLDMSLGKRLYRQEEKWKNVKKGQEKTPTFWRHLSHCSHPDQTGWCIWISFTRPPLSPPSPFSVFLHSLGKVGGERDVEILQQLGSLSHPIPEVGTTAPLVGDPVGAGLPLSQAFVLSLRSPLSVHHPSVLISAELLYLSQGGVRISSKEISTEGSWHVIFHNSSSLVFKYTGQQQILLRVRFTSAFVFAKFMHVCLIHNFKTDRSVYICYVYSGEYIWWTLAES